jgi:hypothetical protein
MALASTGNRSRTYWPRMFSNWRNDALPPDFKVDLRTGVPYPVTASQPGFAGNPVVLQPAELPLRISLNALNPPAYSHG